MPTDTTEHNHLTDADREIMRAVTEHAWKEAHSAVRGRVRRFGFRPGWPKPIARCAKCGREFLSLGARGDMIDHFHFQGEECNGRLEMLDEVMNNDRP